jgi:hypothetical protein
MSRQCPALRRRGRTVRVVTRRYPSIGGIICWPSTSLPLWRQQAPVEEGRRPSLQGGLSNQLSNDGHIVQQSGMDAYGRLCRSTSPARRVPKLLRDKEVTATVAAKVSSCLITWPGSTCRVSTLSIRRRQHQPQPVFSDLCDPEMRATWRLWQPSMRGTLSSHLFVPRDIRSSASRFFRSASGSAWRYFCVVWIWW